MKNTFLNRVSAERRVLTVVNSKFRGRLQLAGLSEAALLQWQGVVGDRVAEDVLLLLLELAEQCQLLSDRSNETFSAMEEAQAARIGAQLEALSLALQVPRTVTAGVPSN